VQARIPPAADIQPPEPEPRDNPVEQAAAQSIKERLAEQQRAEQHRAVPPQQPQRAEEPTDPVEANIAAAPIPEQAKQWLREHSDYLTDARKNAALQHFHWQAVDEAGGEYTDAYYRILETLLGLRAAPAPRPTAPPITAQRQASPSVSVSAPPQRQAPSWSSGRPLADTRVTLTNEEMELSRTLGLDPEVYRREKARMLQLKAAGVIQDAGR
jgi:hypothetical protein